MGSRLFFRNIIGPPRSTTFKRPDIELPSEGIGPDDGDVRGDEERPRPDEVEGRKTVTDSLVGSGDFWPQDWHHIATALDGQNKASDMHDEDRFSQRQILHRILEPAKQKASRAWAFRQEE